MKTPEELLEMYSPNPNAGYGNSWIIQVMKHYAKLWVDETADKLNTTPRWEAMVERLKQEIDAQ